MAELDSRYLSYILRHHPEDIGLKLDEYGYANVDILCKKLDITEEELAKVVAANTRFIYNIDRTKIKAAHGHSVPVKYEGREEPPFELYHGTADRFMKSILKDGLKPQTRDMVHLSERLDEAEKIALRHTAGSKSHIVLLKIYAREMHHSGFKFYKSEDGVWLVSSVPTKYIEVIE